MKEEVRALKAKMRDLRFPEEKLMMLKGALSGRKALVLSCGPSLALLDDTVIRKLSEDRIVFCVKQAVSRAPNLVDFHLLNFVNFQRFECAGEMVSIYQPNHTGEEVYGHGMNFDIVLPANRKLVEFAPRERLSRRLAITREFDAHLFDNTLFRPWGPSILLEIGFYLLLHLGITEAAIVGWDLGPPGERRLIHFNEDRKTRLQNAADLFSKTASRIRRRFPNSSLSQALYARRYKFHQIMGLKMANDAIPEDENRIIIDCAPALFEWLQSKGLEISLLSPMSHLPEEIPRTTVECLLGSEAMTPLRVGNGG